MQETRASILCALCGIKFIPETGSICPTCTIKSLGDQKFLQTEPVNFCRYCERFERPPWINCERESQEMMGILLKKIKGLSKVTFQSASFVWTEPHSKRIKLRVVFSREVSENMKLEMTEVVEFIERYTQCGDCKKKFTPHDWNGLVQIRQHAGHKKTIHNLEQDLIKRKMSDKFLKIEEAENGINIYFATENEAQRLVDFLKGNYPSSAKSSRQLISHNEQNNTSNVKVTFVCYLPEVCKNDLVLIPKKLSKELGSCSQVLLCTKVRSSLHFLDVNSFKKIQISSTQYFLYNTQIEIFPLKIYGKKFTILDSEAKEAETANKHASFGLTVMIEDEYKELYTKCHFEEEIGNDLMGYELIQIQNIEGAGSFPDYLMVHRIKDKELKKKQKSKRRKRLAEERRSEAASIMSQARNQERVDESLSESEEEEEWHDIDDKQGEMEEIKEVNEEAPVDNK